jgi:amidase
MNRRSFVKVAASALATAPLVSRIPRSAAATSKFDPGFATAGEAVRAIRSGVVSARELTEHTYRRISWHNPKVNAFVTLIEEQAMARAREADEALAAGKVWGPLHGLPIVIKDSFSTAGVRTTSGSKKFENRIPREDAVAVARLKRAGAIIIGKTNLPEFARDNQTYNDVAGTTNNPWDPRRTSGGSTGGGAAALAAGFGFLELGSDIAGSIRNPSHFCGVYGHKPTLDVVPGENATPGAPASTPSFLGVSGPMARGAEDLRMMLEIIGGPAPHEAMALQWKLPSPRRARLSDYRIGYMLDDRFCAVTAEVRDVLTNAVDALRKAGVNLREGWPTGVDPEALFDTFYFLLIARNLAGTVRERQASQPEGDADAPWAYYAKRNREALAASYGNWAARTASRLRARAVWQEYFKTYDAFLLPGNFVAAFPHVHEMPAYRRMLDTIEGKRLYYDVMKWTSLATLSGCPATVAPVGRTRGGLPVGLQIMGPYLEDATPIDIARLMADVVGGYEAPPGYA